MVFKGFDYTVVLTVLVPNSLWWWRYECSCLPGGCNCLSHWLLWVGIH